MNRQIQDKLHLFDLRLQPGGWALRSGSGSMDGGGGGGGGGSVDGGAAPPGT